MGSRRPLGCVCACACVCVCVLASRSLNLIYSPVELATASTICLGTVSFKASETPASTVLQLRRVLPQDPKVRVRVCVCVCLSLSLFLFLFLFLFLSLSLSLCHIP